MLKKIKEILSSVRFWQVVIASVVYYLGVVGIIPSTIADAITAVLGVSVSIGTIDKFGKNIGQ